MKFWVSCIYQDFYFMLILQIPDSCHENWEQMQPEERGCFCLSCQKIVVDFSTRIDEAVKNYLLDKQHQKICGRFLASQIGRPLKNEEIQIDTFGYRQLPYTKQVFYANRRFKNLTQRCLYSAASVFLWSLSAAFQSFFFSGSSCSFFAVLAIIVF